MLFVPLDLSRAEADGVKMIWPGLLALNAAFANREPLTKMDEMFARQIGSSV